MPYLNPKTCYQPINHKILDHDTKIIRSFRPQTIAEFLYLQRVSMITKIASEYSVSFDTRLAFFICAHASNFGIEPLNNHERGLRLLEDKKTAAKIEETLVKKMEQRYTPMSIMNELFIRVENELRANYSYTGSVSSDAGYPSDVTEKLLRFFQKLLLGDAIKECLFLVNDYGQIYDINWPVVKMTLCYQLWDKEYLIFSYAEKELFEALYNVDEEEDLLGKFCDADYFHRVLINLELFHYKEFLKHLPEEQIHLLIQSFFYTEDSNLKDSDLLSIFSQFGRYHDQMNLDEIERYCADVSQRWLSKKKNFNHLSHMISALSIEKDALDLIIYFPIDDIKRLAGTLEQLAVIFHRMILKNESASAVFLRKIKTLPIEEQIVIFQKQNSDHYNALMYVAKYQSDLLPDIFDAIKALPASNQTQIWTQTTGIQCNILMLALLGKISRHKKVERFSLISKLIKEIHTLDEPLRFLIFKQQCLVNHHNMIMIASSVDNGCFLIKILTAISTLSEKHQYELWSAIDRKGSNALLVAVQAMENNLPKVLTFVNQLDIHSKTLILKNLSENTSDIKTSKMVATELLSSIISSFNTTIPIEQALYQCLSAMSVNANYKKRMIVYALADLNIDDKQPTFEERIAAALIDSQSALSSALRIRRYGGCGLFGQNSRSKALLKIAISIQNKSELDLVLNKGIKIKAMYDDEASELHSPPRIVVIR